ncbi:MAG: type II toxin-antitoxin system ParD family antitoxin [Sedimenticola sp.]
MAETLKNMSFSLGGHDRSFINDQVEHGRFGNKTEVVRAGLRLLEDYENKQKALRALVDEGLADIEAGRYKEYDSAESLLNDIMQD